MEHDDDDRRPLGRPHWIRVILLIPVIASLWVPFYNRIEPTLGGVPFFYWYQLAWVLIGAALMAIVYVATANNQARGQTDQ